MPDVYLIRHTAVGVADGTCYGDSDIPLAAEHPAHIDAVRSRLARHVHAPAQVYSSPLSRCTTLASAIGGGFAPDARLKEMHFGAWELRPWAELPREELDAWRRDIEDYPVPGGESFAALAARAGAFLDDLVATDDSPSVVVTHGGVIRALLARALDCPLSVGIRFEIAFGSITAIRFERQRVQVLFVNG